MKLTALSVLIGLLLIFGIAEILFCKIVLEILFRPLVMLMISVINFLVILIVIRRQPVQMQKGKS
jgi:hypothetical protein